MTKLLNELIAYHQLELETVSQLPINAQYSFGQFSTRESQGETLSIQKTTKRTVVSLNYSTFQAREMVHEQKNKETVIAHKSSELLEIVPQGARYAYDLIAHVGTKSYIEGRKLKDIHYELVCTKKICQIPFSSLFDIQRKFIFYFGELHRQAATRIKEYLRDRGKVTWLIDGTLEPGSPVFFGIKEAQEGIFLDSWKIPTENEEDISRCLTEAVKLFGEPESGLHDLSQIMINSWKTALPHVRHKVCQYHLTSDIGEDLYKVPQETLTKRLRAMKLQPQLREQRKGQVDWLRKKIKKNDISLVLTELLNKNQNISSSRALGHEVLLALHYWILDYPSDSNRQGYPYDPYTLYHHRRIVKAHDSTKRLLAIEAVRRKAPKALFNFCRQLEKYLIDPAIIDAVNLYEKAYDIFDRTRKVLRLTAKGQNPMRESYKLNSIEQSEVKECIKQLLIEYENISRDCANPEERKLYDIVLTHLNKYKHYLFSSGEGDKEDCTTNGIETHWRTTKRMRRQTHGRKNLTRDFQALPEEYMLMPNLLNPRYIEIVLGSIEKLPEKLAEAGKTAGPFSHWCKKRKPLNIGQIPLRFRLNDNFLDQLMDIYGSQCQN